jgi:hypothetical protein
MKYNSMAEVYEWIDSDHSSEEEHEMVDYFDVESYINGLIDHDELSDDPNWLPHVPEVLETSDSPDWWEWWDVNADPNYLPNVTEAPAVVVEV